jgi:hypothetical protein
VPTTTIKRNPRAAFAAMNDEQLHDELGRLESERVRLIDSIEAKRPTREEIAQQVEALRAKRADRLSHQRVTTGLSALANAVPGSRGFRDVEELVLYYVLSSEGFADAVEQVLAQDRPTEADLEPSREQLADVVRRRRAAEMERELRELDAHQADENARRAELEARLRA